VRIIQPQFSANLGAPVVLVNKGGAGGAIGMEYVAKAKPDGYTVAASVKSTLTIVPASRKDLPYKVADFAVVGSYAIDSQGLLSRPNAPWKTLDEMIAYAKKNPGKLTYGSAGTGTIRHLNMEMMKLAWGLDIAHVPFGGTGPVKNAILGGHVDLASTALSPMLPLVRAGDLVTLVTTAPRRIPGLEAPTMVEKGLPEASLSTTSQLYVPSRTPREVIDRLTRALEKTMKDPSVIAAVEKAGMVADYRDPDSTRKDIEAEFAAIAPLAAKLGLVK
jgi:tripartite-type tricarboxylate transporter receptor subunit TctC